MINKILSSFNLDKRTVKAYKNILQMLFLKGGTMIISLLYVPLLINTLTVYNYGIWLTITSLVAWVTLFDIGIGNGLRNNLSEALAKDNISEANIFISTSYVVLFLFTIIFAVIFTIINFFLDWSIILNVSNDMSSELKKIISIVFYFFSIQFVLNLINSILLAFQRPALSSLILFIGQLLSFIIIWISVKIFVVDSFVYLSALISIIPVLVLFIFSFYIFKFELKEYRPKLINYRADYIGKIFNLGIKFFILQIITLIIFQTNNLIIAHKLGPSFVTDYNIAYKYIGIIAMIFAIILTPFWSATTEAYHRDDLKWIREIVLKLNFIWVGMLLIGCGLIYFSTELYYLWVGDNIIVDKKLLFLLLIYFTIYMRYGIYGYIINGIGKVKLQLIITGIIAILYIPTTLFFAESFGLYGIILSMILFILINAVWSQLQYFKLVNKKAQGIWDS
jgi:O-antigen/teichoic acid export membrane protein